MPNRLITRIQVDREIGLTLYAFDQVKTVQLGYDDYPVKYDRLEKVLFHLSKRPDLAHFSSIDLNNSDRISINPVAGESIAEKQKEV